MAVTSAGATTNTGAVPSILTLTDGGDAMLPARSLMSTAAVRLLPSPFTVSVLRAVWLSGAPAGTSAAANPDNGSVALKTRSSAVLYQPAPFATAGVGDTAPCTKMPTGATLGAVESMLNVR